MSSGEIYNDLLVERLGLQPHVFLSSPYPLMLIIFGYLYFILYAGPNYMKDRAPYKLKSFILIYDLIQILANSWLVKAHLSSGWNSPSNIICLEDSTTLNVPQLFDIWQWILLIKIFDFVETCIFVLRKKQNQVSVLHVYHHISNVIFGWYYMKYFIERLTFVILLNSIVHVIMYMYYFIAAWSPTLQQIVLPIKPYITKLQMVQFVAIIIYALQIFNPRCSHPVEVSHLLFIVNIIIFLYLFYDFYKKNYHRKQKNY
jgi:elongation of very long chain fatty acids protein 7